MKIVDCGICDGDLVCIKLALDKIIHGMQSFHFTNILVLFDIHKVDRHKCRYCIA